MHCVLLTIQTIPTIHWTHGSATALPLLVLASIFAHRRLVGPLHLSLLITCPYHDCSDINAVCHFARQMVSSNEEDGVWVEDGARVDIWSMDADTGEGAMIRQNAWCGIRVSGPTTKAKCSQAKIKLNGQHGLLAEQGAAVSARLLDVDANTGTGVLATHEGTVVDMFGCTSTGNRVGLASFSSLIRANNCRVVSFSLYVHDDDARLLPFLSSSSSSSSTSFSFCSFGSHPLPTAALR